METGNEKAGRDLTANDVDDALHIDCPTNEQIAERLNRIARGAPERGDEMTFSRDEDGSGSGFDGIRSWTHEVTITERREEPDGLWQTIRDYLDENDLGDELLVRLGTSGHFAVGSLPAMPPEVTEALDYLSREIDAFAYPEVPQEARLHAAALSRWLLSVVEGEPPAPERDVRAELAESFWDPSVIAAARPPGPEPQAAESASVILFKDTGKYYTTEEWRIPETTHDGYRVTGPYDMIDSPDFRRINGGAVLVETQEPWGFPHLFPGVAAAGAVRVEGEQA